VNDSLPFDQSSEDQTITIIYLGLNLEVWKMLMNDCFVKKTSK